jgi:tRNA (adenine37-N6)-methyltransferase
MTAPAIRPIGRASAGEGGFAVLLDKEYRAGLEGLDGFSHVLILWWADGADTPAERARIRVAAPYPGAPEELGVFATRSPARPNPIGLTAAPILSADPASGIARFAWFDLEDGTPVLDLKPYHPSADRIADARLPPWFANWPGSLEESACFDWSRVFG